MSQKFLGVNLYNLKTRTGLAGSKWIWNQPSIATLSQRPCEFDLFPNTATYTPLEQLSGRQSFWLFFQKSPHSCGRYGTRLGEDELFMVKAYTYFDEPPAPTGHVHDKSVCVLFLWGEGGWVRLHVAMVFILLFLVLNIHPCLLQFFRFFFQSESAISILIPDFVTSIPQNYSFILLITYHSQNKLSSVHNHTMPVENFRKACLEILHCFDGAFLSIMKYNNSR